MSPGRTSSWILVGILFLTPVLCLGAWLAGTMPPGLASSVVLAAGAISWGVGGGLARILFAGGAALKRQREQQENAQREALAMEVLMAQPLTPIKPARATLRLGEYAYGAVEGGLQPINAAGAQTAGGRGSKKIVFRAGATPGGAMPKATVMATGELVITDQRVIFTGDAKSFAIPLDQLMAVTKYADGFGFEDEKFRYEVVTAAAAERTAFAQALYKITQR